MANIVDFTVLANVLEKDILPSVKVQVYKKSVLWQIFGGFKAEEDGSFGEKRVNPPQISFANNTIYVTTQNGRPATTSITTGNKFIYGAVPTNQGNLSIATAVGSFLVPKAVLSMKDEGAIVNALQFNMTAMINSLSMDLNRQCYGDGSATLAYTSTSGVIASGTNVTLIPKATASTLYNNDIPLAVRYFSPTVGGVNGTPVVVGGTNTTVKAITGNNTITFNDSVTLNEPSGPYMSIVKLDGSNSAAAEMTGLSSIVNTNTYMGINPATDATWQGYVDSHSGTATTIAMTDINKAFLNANTTGNVKYIIMNMTEFQKYGELLTNISGAAQPSLYRFGPEDAIYGGWSALTYMGGNAAVILDYDCPDDRVYLLSPEYLFRAELQPLEFEPGTLGKGERVTQQLDYEVVADLMGNIGTFVRSANGVLTNRVG